MTKRLSSSREAAHSQPILPWVLGILAGMVITVALISVGVLLGPRISQVFNPQPPAESAPAAAQAANPTSAVINNTAVPASASSNAGGNNLYPDLVFPPAINRPNVITNSMGADDAPVLVENISNFQCVHCTTFTVGDILGTAGAKITESKIFSDYVATGKVRFKYITYSWTPDQQFAPEEGAYCAGDQGKFFEYRDLVFLNKDNAKIGGLTKENLVLFANALNLDMAAFNECFDTHKYFYKIEEDMTYAKNAGLTGTPSFIVNGKMVFSAALVSTIESELARLQGGNANSVQASAPTNTPALAPASSQELVIQPVDKTKIIIPAVVERVKVKDDGMGDPNAKVKVEYFAYFGCSICAAFTTGGSDSGSSDGVFETVLSKTYVPEGKVYYRYVPFSWDPQSNFSPEEAVYCAMDQGKFWEYRDLVFVNRSNSAIGGLTPSSLTAFAEILGLNMGKFNDCFKSQKYHQRVLDNVAYATASGPLNTLYFLVNGKVVSEAKLVQTIEQELAK